MAGGGDTPDLVAAVCEAGGFGFVGAAYLAPAQIVEVCRAVRQRTRQPFGINLFALEQTTRPADTTAAIRRLTPYFDELGLPPPEVPDIPTRTFRRNLPPCWKAMSALSVLPSDGFLRPRPGALKARGIFTLGTATTVDEARALSADGVDAVIAQGAEAGGHRGTFGAAFEAALVGTMALVPQIVDALNVPVLASGGIMDGRGIAAALALGASGVQLGTAFLTCDEAGVPEAYKRAVLAADETATSITRAFSGRPARGIGNRFMREVGADAGAILPFPWQNALTRPMRSAAAKTQRAEFLSLWAGQGARMARRQPAAELMRNLIRDCDATVAADGCQRARQHESRRRAENSAVNIPQQMHYIQAGEPGGPDVLRLATSTLPVPKAHEVLIRVLAAGVNRPDVIQRKGVYPPPPDASPVLGLEVAGVVVSVGAAAGEWAVGDRVCALTNGGGYAEYCVAPAGQCLRWPRAYDERHAAALPENYFTVWANIFQMGKLRLGESMLVHGGTSGIGFTAIQLAREFGSRVFATAGSAVKCAAAVKYGAAAAINYHDEDFAERIAALTDGEGVDVILDIVGAPYFARNLRCLRKDGRLVEVATMQGAKVDDFDISELMRRRATITGSMMRPRSLLEKSQIAQALAERVWPILDAGRCTPVVDRVFALAQAADAHRYMESGAHIGKIVLQVGG